MHDCMQVMDALQRQGLHNTDYGRQIIAMTQTVRPTRFDNLTTVQQMSYGRQQAPR